MLKALNLGHNELTGQISGDIVSLVDLETLSLASNELNGANTCRNRKSIMN